MIYTLKLSLSCKENNRKIWPLEPTLQNQIKPNTLTSDTLHYYSSLPTNIPPALLFHPALVFPPPLALLLPLTSLTFLTPLTFPPTTHTIPPTNNSGYRGGGIIMAGECEGWGNSSAG